MEINRIVVTGRLYKEMKASIGEIPSKEIKFLPENEVTDDILKWADAYVGFNLTKNFDFYNIKWVHALKAGVDGYLLSREWKREVLLTRTICSFGEKISEYCLSYILAELQRHNDFYKNQELNIWETKEPVMLKNQKILIFGTGVIGHEVAKNLALLGAKIIGVSQSGNSKKYFEKVIKVDDVREYFSKVNWIINTLPLTKVTENIFNKSIFENLNSAKFINVGRGGSVKEDDLVQAIADGNIALAVLDVFKDEPLPKTSILWNNPKIRITPHISAITTNEEAIECFLETLALIEKDKYPLINQVDIIKGY